MQPLIDIYQGILTALAGLGIPPKWVDLDMGQLEPGGKHLPLSYPALLCKFDDVIWKDESDTVQIGLVTVTLKVIFKFKSDAEILASQTTARAEVVSSYQLLHNIHQATTGISGTTFNKLRRFNQFQYNADPKNLISVQVLQYVCNIKSDSSNPDSALSIDFDHVKNYNAFLERRKIN